MQYTKERPIFSWCVDKTLSITNMYKFCLSIIDAFTIIYYFLWSILDILYAMYGRLSNLNQIFSQ